MFKKGELYNLIVGSSNLTANALCANKEWNLKVSAANNSDLVHQTILEFEASFISATPVTSAFIEHYRLIYNRERTFRSKLAHIRGEEPIELLVPNKMQEIALQNLHSLRQKGQSKGLLISATGTGKTYLSAFDAKQFGAKKFLNVGKSLQHSTFSVWCILLFPLIYKLLNGVHVPIPTHSPNTFPEVPADKFGVLLNILNSFAYMYCPCPMDGVAPPPVEATSNPIQSPGKNGPILN